jgi:hypothetical protein
MWFNTEGNLINQRNIVKISTESINNSVKIFALLTSNETILLGTFKTAPAAEYCIENIKDQIKRHVEFIDLKALVNSSNLSYAEIQKYKASHHTGTI